MVGLGETEAEVLETMDDLRQVNCSIFTIGQYLQPTPSHLQVVEFIHPDIFEKYRVAGIDKGFTHVESKPLVRSSYHAVSYTHLDVYKRQPLWCRSSGYKGIVQHPFPG